MDERGTRGGCCSCKRPCSQPSMKIKLNDARLVHSVRAHWSQCALSAASSASAQASASTSVLYAAGPSAANNLICLAKATDSACKAERAASEVVAPTERQPE
jgi:hypothetical protein